MPRSGPESDEDHVARTRSLYPLNTHALCDSVLLCVNRFNKLEPSVVRFALCFSFGDKLGDKLLK